MTNKKMYLILVVIVILSGCTSNKTNEELDNSITVSGMDGEIIERSEYISDIIVELYGIDDATTIILNDTALIGLKIAYDQELTEETVDVIKSMVIEEDSYINDVRITNKEKLFGEINNVVNDLLQGKTYDSLVNDINKIKNKIN